MPIVSSSVSVGHAQADGRRYLTLRYVDDAGAVLLTSGLVGAGVDPDALLAQRAALINEKMAESEADALMADAPFVLRHQTLAQFASRFWARTQAAHLDGRRFDYHRLVAWLMLRVQAGDLTSEQVRQSLNAFFGASMNAAQWSAFVATKLVPMRSRYESMISEGGPNG